MTTTNCAECGKEDGGVSLKACKSCMQAKYCDAKCQKNHWPKHKKACKQRAAELRDEALFQVPPAKEDCPICFLPMPVRLLPCISLPPATILSVPIKDFADENEALAAKATKQYYPCCGKSICAGCIYSLCESGNIWTCPFCNSDRSNKTEEERVQELMKRVEVNDPGAIKMLAGCYYQGLNGVQRDHAKANELFTKSAELGCSEAHRALGNNEGGDMKKTKFHLEAAAMLGHENSRCNLGNIEAQSGNMERAVKHWTIAASAGDYIAMHHLRICFEKGSVCRESIDSILTAYNSSCAEMRSEARDAAIQSEIDTI